MGLLLLAGCMRTDSPHGPAPEAKTAQVEMISPVQKALLKGVEQPGVVQAFEMASLHARVAGYVKAVKADIGDRVKKGDVLCELSVPELLEEANEKAARVRQADAEITQALKALAVAKSQGDEMKAGVARADALHERWELENNRVAALVKRGVADDQTRDETRSQHKAAAAALDEARARFAAVGSLVAKAEADVLAARARKDVAAAEEKRVQAMVGYMTIRAPFAGVVTARKVSPGDLVRPTEGAAVFQVAMLDPVRVVIQVPEADAGLVGDGLKVVLALPTGAAEARVTRTSWGLAPGSRTLRVEADVANPKGTLRPGMYAYAKFQGEMPNRWVLPAAAVARLGDVLAVFRVVDGKAVLTPVELGHADGGFVQVLRWQSQATPPRWEMFSGEEKVAAKAVGLFDGQAVVVK